MEKDKNGFEKHVSNERTHLSQVRRAFADGIKTENPDPRSVNFLIACCDYLSFSLRRLIEQDHVLHQRLIPHVSEDSKEYKVKLNKLETGLVSMEQFIDNLENSKNHLITTGLYGFQEFKIDAEEFLDAFLNMLASNRHSTYELEKEVFSEDDWEAIACISEEAVQKENELYQSVLACSPEDCNPKNYPPIGHNQNVE